MGRFAVLGACVLLVGLVVGTAEARKGGYWCWTHQDGEYGSCAPLEEQCLASLEGYNQTARALHDEEVKGSCKWQKSAWQFITNPAPNPPSYLPTKKMCTRGLQKGDRCKQVF